MAVEPGDCRKALGACRQVSPHSFSRILSQRRNEAGMYGWITLSIMAEAVSNLTADGDAARLARRHHPGRNSVPAMLTLLILSMSSAAGVHAEIGVSSHTPNPSHPVLGILHEASDGDATLGISSFDNSGSQGWGQLQGDAQHDGYSTSPGPTSSTVAWSESALATTCLRTKVCDQKIDTTGPYDGIIAVNGKLVVTVPDQYFQYFFGFSESMGTRDYVGYTARTMQGDPVAVSTVYPASGGGLIYLGNHCVFCWLSEGPWLVADEGNDGSVNSWVQSRTAAPQESPYYGWAMVTYDSAAIFYIPYNSSTIYAYDAASGSLSWQKEANGKLATVPTMTNGVILLGYSDHNEVVALSESSGQILWTFTTDGPVVGSPSSDGQSFYFGTSSGTVYRVSSTGSQEWKTHLKLDSRIVSTPAVDSTSVYVTSVNGQLYSFDKASGSINWTEDTGSAITASAAIASNGVVYVGNSEGVVYAYNTGDGRQLWQYSTSSPINTNFVLDNGYLFTIDSTGFVYAFGPAKPASTVTPSNLSGFIKLNVELSGSQSKGYYFALTIGPNEGTYSGSFVSMSKTEAEGLLQDIGNEMQQSGFPVPTSMIVTVEPTGFVDTSPITNIGNLFSLVDQLEKGGQAISDTIVSESARIGAAEIGTEYVAGTLVPDWNKLISGTLTGMFDTFNSYVTAASSVGETALFNSNIARDTIGGSLSQFYNPEFVAGPGQELAFIVFVARLPSSLPVTFTVSGDYETVDYLASHPIFQPCTGSTSNTCYYFASFSFSTPVEITSSGSATTSPGSSPAPFGIPEFPFQTLVPAAFTLLILVSYLLVRHERLAIYFVHWLHSDARTRSFPAEAQ